MPNETIAFVYKWTHLPSYSWYVGVRYAEGCHPNDGYICSSKTVKPRILANPGEWKRELIDTGSSSDMRQLEKLILEEFFDPLDIRCLNKSKIEAPPLNKRPVTLLTRRRISESLKGEKHPLYGKKHSKSTLEKMRASHLGNRNHNFGKKASIETIQKLRDSHLGSSPTKSTIEKLRIAAFNRDKVTCPFCGKTGGKPQMIRWHFDNCNYKP